MHAAVIDVLAPALCFSCPLTTIRQREGAFDCVDDVCECNLRSGSAQPIPSKRTPLRLHHPSTDETLEDLLDRRQRKPSLPGRTTRSESSGCTTSCCSQQHNRVVRKLCNSQHLECRSE